MRHHYQHYTALSRRDGDRATEAMVHNACQLVSVLGCSGDDDNHYSVRDPVIGCCCRSGKIGSLVGVAFRDDDRDVDRRYNCDGS